MNPQDDDQAPAPGVEIDSAKAFGNAIVDAATQALQRRARRLVFVDPDFSDWPLDDAGLHASLTAFVRLPGRELVLLGRSFDAMQRRCPRFVGWRRSWGHAVAVWRPSDEEVSLPSVLLADRVLAVELLDRVDWRGRVMTDVRADVLSDLRRIQRLADEVDVFLQRCEPTFGASTLGL